MSNRFSVSKSPVKFVLQNGGFSECKGLNRKYSNRHPQKSLPFEVFCVNFRSGEYAAALLKNPKKTNVKTSHMKTNEKITYLGAETLNRSLQNFAYRVTVHDVIAPANFGGDWFSGFGVVCDLVKTFLNC